jgi:hypothetical protein
VVQQGWQSGRQVLSHDSKSQTKKYLLTEHNNHQIQPVPCSSCVHCSFPETEGVRVQVVIIQVDPRFGSISKYNCIYQAIRPTRIVASACQPLHSRHSAFLRSHRSIPYQGHNVLHINPKLLQLFNCHPIPRRSRWPINGLEIGWGPRTRLMALTGRCRSRHHQAQQKRGQHRFQRRYQNTFHHANKSTCVSMVTTSSTSSESDANSTGMLVMGNLVGPS